MSQLTYYSYFGSNNRTDGKRYYSLVEGCPELLRELCYDVHSYFDAMPNDWIYEQIMDAFHAFERDGVSVDDLSLEPDCYHQQLYQWLGNSYADAMIDEAQENGLVKENAGIWDRIGSGQWYAMDRIYHLVSEFLEDNPMDEVEEETI